MKSTLIRLLTIVSFILLGGCSAMSSWVQPGNQCNQGQTVMKNVSQSGVDVTQYCTPDRSIITVTSTDDVTFLSFPRGYILKGSKDPSDQKSYYYDRENNRVFVIHVHKVEGRSFLALHPEALHIDGVEWTTHEIAQFNGFEWPETRKIEYVKKHYTALK